MRDFENFLEATRYAKETGKNLKSGKDYKKGGRGAVKDPALKAVLDNIYKTHSKKAVHGATSRQEPKSRGATDPEAKSGRAGKYYKKQQAKKSLANKAAKAGFKNSQDYINVVAVHGGEDNYKAGRGAE